MDNNILGKRLKKLREKSDLNQLEFSKILNISNTTLSQYEAGNRTPSDEIKEKIADYFCVSVDYLLGRTEIKGLQENEVRAENNRFIDVTGLPEDDIKKVEEYVELLKQKHHTDGRPRNKQAAAEAEGFLLPC